MAKSKNRFCVGVYSRRFFSSGIRRRRLYVRGSNWPLWKISAILTYFSIFRGHPTLSAFFDTGCAIDARNRRCGAFWWIFGNTRRRRSGWAGTLKILPPGASVPGEGESPGSITSGISVPRPDPPSVTWTLSPKWNRFRRWLNLLVTKVESVEFKIEPTNYFGLRLFLGLGGLNTIH